MVGVDVALADLGGVWRRTLVPEADGSTDRTSSVTWVQGPTLFGDLRQPAGLDAAVGASPLRDLDHHQLLALCGQRAFAGTLQQDGEAFSWVRRIDLHPTAPLPDTGTLRWEEGVLVEEGLHEAYLEHWERIGGPPAAPAAALLEDPQDGCTGLLVRAGSWFCYARDRYAPLPMPLVSLVEQVGGCDRRAQGAALLDCEVSVGRVRAGRWEIVRSTLPHRVGTDLAPEWNRTGDKLRIRDADRDGRPHPRDWQPVQAEGPVRALTAGDARARNRTPGAVVTDSQGGSAASRPGTRRSWWLSRTRRTAQSARR
ncbi:hypothetical protein [Streptacidiphilus anmyonensis]|uniref:hypothetical protein n=1 Tax=Streptacidiphilus anmyonensis TaxID=405782 RepID=UPI0006943350|nr:hypothetical protein [Streptacidiphilus anmyonensis]